MALVFRNVCEDAPFYVNDLGSGDLYSSRLVEKSEVIRFGKGSIDFTNWCFDGYRLARSIVQCNESNNVLISNDIDAVKLYFNQGGRLAWHCRQFSKDFLIGKGQFSMLYSDMLETECGHLDSHSNMFSLQVTREVFVDLIGTEAGSHFRPFIKSLLEKKPAIYAAHWAIMTAKMDRCIYEILHCPFNGMMRQLFLKAKVIELLVLSLEFINKQGRAAGSPVGSSTDRKKLHLVRDYLIENYMKPTSLSDLCLLTGLNEFKLKKGFRELFGVSTIEFLIQYRLETAHALLGNSDLTISEIAYTTGYSSVGYFISAYRKRFGRAPRSPLV